MSACNHICTPVSALMYRQIGFLSELKYHVTLWFKRCSIIITFVTTASGRLCPVSYWRGDPCQDVGM